MDMEQQNPWQQFQQTGSVQAYLEYCQWKHTHSQEAESVRRQEESHANQYRWPGDPGKQRGGK